ncbi:Zn(II)2Cys6 transcription factor [Aspergillus alliaceus]|uniref:Zn(II)2Cys6 transcription factor n=1 Tax=Petromyces alliaceus TaxID=209559 RepID=UPI0012A74C31|nr:uncharacterized protein BDW43DRAFT_166924 [Aspergillus alliaceus]KAB8230400.1 hypothetical protein BDW43DRAFT_166924 [Aspergillus alliaceus]
MSTPRNRSHDGCWTCKRIRRKCDQTHPACLVCQRRAVKCEGYEIRLRWGSGIASRGRFIGACEPVEASIPPRVKGRRRDLSRERRRASGTLCSEIYQSSGWLTLSQTNEPVPEVNPDIQSSAADEKERLFREFLSSGINVLHSTSVNDARINLKLRLPTLCVQSSSLYAICVALQASMSPNLRSQFFEHFDVALNLFRAELSRNVTYLEDGTLTAGLLLCSIGLMHAMPWTMHLHGMYGILQAHGLHGPGEQTEFRTHLLEVMGVMDLPTFTVGRSTSLGFWRRYCRGRVPSQPSSGDEEVEVVSGLPRSLLDIISCIGEGATEEHFWDWSGSPGSLSQHQLWEAYRLAGMLAVRHSELLSVPQPQTMQTDKETSRVVVLPSTAIIVSRVLGHLDALRRASPEEEAKGSLILNAIKYPAFIAGLQADIFNAHPEFKVVIRCCLSTYQHRHRFGEDFDLLLEVLEEWWVHHHEMTSPHQLALGREMEIGLL